MEVSYCQYRCVLFTHISTFDADCVDGCSSTNDPRTLYNHRLSILLNVLPKPGTGPRSVVKYSPHGNIIMLAGFGNLRGEVQFWSRKNLNLINQLSAQDTTSFAWCPDSEHLMTATCSPRLKVPYFRSGTLVPRSTLAHSIQAFVYLTTLESLPGTASVRSRSCLSLGSCTLAVQRKRSQKRQRRRARDAFSHGVRMRC